MKRSGSKKKESKDEEYDDEDEIEETSKPKTMNFYSFKNVADVTLGEVFGTKKVEKREVMKTFRKFVTDNEVREIKVRKNPKLTKVTKFWDELDLEDMEKDDIKELGKLMSKAGIMKSKTPQSRLFKLFEDDHDEFVEQLTNKYEAGIKSIS